MLASSAGCGTSKRFRQTQPLPEEERGLSSTPGSLSSTRGTPSSFPPCLLGWSGPVTVHWGDCTPGAVWSSGGNPDTAESPVGRKKDQGLGAGEESIRAQHTGGL